MMKDNLYAAFFEGEQGHAEDMTVAQFLDRYHVEIPVSVFMGIINRHTPFHVIATDERAQELRVWFPKEGRE